MTTDMKTLREALSTIHRVATGQSDAAYMSVPADPRRDADLLLSAALDELEALRKLVLDVHDALHAECDGKADLPTEIRALRVRAEKAEGLCAEWSEKAKTWMGSPAAAARLDGYRELAARLAEAERELDELRSQPCEGLGCGVTLGQLEDEPEGKGGGTWFCAACWNAALRRAREHAASAQREACAKEVEDGGFILFFADKRTSSAVVRRTPLVTEEPKP